MDVSILEVMNFGGCDLGFMDVPKDSCFGGFDHWMFQFWRLLALEVVILGFMDVPKDSCFWRF